MSYPGQKTPTALYWELQARAELAGYIYGEAMQMHRLATADKPAHSIWFVGHKRASLNLPPAARVGDWMVADQIGGTYCNHRSYDGLASALDAEAS